MRAPFIYINVMQNENWTTCRHGSAILLLLVTGILKRTTCFANCREFQVHVQLSNYFFFKLIYYIENIYKVYKDKLQNCSCNQFHYIGTYKQVETNSMTKNRVKAVPLQAWTGPEGSRKLRLPDFVTTAQDGGKVVSLTHRPPLPPGNTPGTHFC